MNIHDVLAKETPADQALKESMVKGCNDPDQNDGARVICKQDLVEIENPQDDGAVIKVPDGFADTDTPLALITYPETRVVLLDRNQLETSRQTDLVIWLFDNGVRVDLEDADSWGSFWQRVRIGNVTLSDPPESRKSKRGRHLRRRWSKQEIPDSIRKLFRLARGKQGNWFSRLFVRHEFN